MSTADTLPANRWPGILFVLTSGVCWGVALVVSGIILLYYLSDRRRR